MFEKRENGEGENKVDKRGTLISLLFIFCVLPEQVHKNLN